ncbi:MAG: putative oxidoreductase [Acidimicrobiia bacterium]|nr:putative oxidoreductase [Acidimicrobiia bacterium]
MTRQRLGKLSRSIDGKVAVVTGSASGIGRACAYLFADEGAKVVIADLGQDRVDAVVKEITDAGGEALGVVCDVSDHDQLKHLVAATIERFGALDILVNNAGTGPMAGATTEESVFEERWRSTFAVNVESQIRLIRLALPYLQASGAGRVVNIASTEGIIATAGGTPYTASKHAVIGVTKSMAVELGATGVTVNCVCPGATRTGITAGIPDEAKDKYARRRVALRRYAEPEEIAHMVLSLTLPAASYVNGSVVLVDGGLTIRH